MSLVIGIGNPDRGDDAAGLLVARRVREVTATGDVRVTELIGDQLGLLDAWTGARDVYVIDAVYSGGPVGAVYRFDGAGSLDARFARRGTHTFGLADVVALGRALGRLPGHLAGYGIEGATFGIGTPLSPAVEAAAGIVASLLAAELKAGA
jgi:hydrogenase maturation protease